MIAIVAIVPMSYAGCSNDREFRLTSKLETSNMTTGKYEEAAMPYEPDDDIGDEQSSPVAAVRARHEQRFMSIDGVRGVGIGMDEIGGDIILLYLLDEAAKERVPDEIEGIPIRTIVVGEIDAQSGPGH